MLEKAVATSRCTGFADLAAKADQKLVHAATLIGCQHRVKVGLGGLRVVRVDPPKAVRDAVNVRVDGHDGVPMRVREHAVCGLAAYRMDR